MDIKEAIEYVRSVIVVWGRMSKVEENSCIQENLNKAMSIIINKYEETEKQNGILKYELSLLKKSKGV